MYTPIKFVENAYIIHVFMHTLFTFLCIYYSLFYYAHEFIRKKRQKKESLNQVNEQLEQEGSESSSLTHS